MQDNSGWALLRIPSKFWVLSACWIPWPQTFFFDSLLVKTCKQIIPNLLKKKFTSSREDLHIFKIISNLKELGRAKFMSNIVQLVCIMNSFLYNPQVRGSKTTLVVFTFLFLPILPICKQREKQVLNQLWNKNMFRIKHRFSEHGQNNVSFCYFPIPDPNFHKTDEMTWYWVNHGGFFDTSVLILLGVNKLRDLFGIFI